MSNIREVLENYAIDYLSTRWDDEDGGGCDSKEQERLLDEAELAINKIVLEARIDELQPYKNNCADARRYTQNRITDLEANIVELAQNNLTK
jgi:hypothetical protein